MNLNKHSNLEGKHAFLSASKYHWLGYSKEKLIEVYRNWKAAQRGTEDHDFARRCIERGQKLPRARKTLNMYVNDAIGFKMIPEVILYYSDNCFGTADTLSFRNGILRIHDLKTGTTPAHMEQLMIYAALYCLEYGVRPENIEIVLRIYQMNDIFEFIPEPEQINEIMSKIIEGDLIVETLKAQEDDIA